MWNKSRRKKIALLVWLALALAACSGDVGGGPVDDPDPDTDVGPDVVDASPDATDSGSDEADTGSDIADTDGDVADTESDARDTSPTDTTQDTGDVGPPVLQDWSDGDKAYRMVLQLEPHPDRDRVDLPVIARIEHPSEFVETDVSIFEIAGGTETPVPGSAWTGPSGHDAQVGFEAPGTTPAGESRVFAVYYNVGETASPWQWDDDGWASAQSAGGLAGISGGCCEILWEVNEETNVVLAGRRSGEQTALRLLDPDWKVAEGFGFTYQLEASTATYAPISLNSAPYDGLLTDGDDFQVAFAAEWSFDAPVAHTTSLASRTFRQWSFAQVMLAVRSPTRPLLLSSNDWNARQIYLTDTFDQMISDTFDATVLVSEWDTGMRWLVVYDSSTNRGVGWLTEHEGVVRADNTTPPTRFFDSYGYSAGGTLRFDSLWMASDDKDAIIALFDAMKPGHRISSPESRDLNILNPEDGSYVFPGDSMQARVSTPGSSLEVTASFELPDGSTLPVEMSRVGESWVWEATSPLVLDSSSPAGRWTLTVHSGTVTRRATVEVRHPNHPRLLFGASDLADLRARRDSSHAEIWANMLSAAEGYDAAMEDPGVGRDIRSYAERLINLGLVQLMDPEAPHADKLWDYFYKMLRYPNWTDPDNPFNNEDLTIGHFLTALSLIYDWHYDGLSTDVRGEVRDRLADMADEWLGSGWIRNYPDIDWTHFGTVTNNHYWIRHEGIAAVAFVLEEEVPETRRQTWVERTEANLAVVLSVLEPDGASNEGVAYHSYGQINLFPWIDMRDRALGGNTATSIPWFENSILWDLYSITPGGDDNYGGIANFGDCPPRHYNPPRTIQAWLAARLNNGTAQWMAESLDWTRTNPLSYLWYDPDVAAVSPYSHPVWHLAANRGIFVWRSSWHDDATYFSLKSGSYFGGHEQPDAGHFILHRAGVPYLTDLGYSYLKMTDEHNLILVDGAGQYGQDRQWMGSVDPAHWGSVPFVLGDENYFDMVADPAPMVESSDLERWDREVVGLHPDVFLVRDSLQASTEVEWTWLLHSYVSDPPGNSNQTYSYRERRLENPWVEQGGGHWLVQPQDTAPDLHVVDCSSASWTAVVEPTLFVPEQKLDVGGYNADFEPFQLGHRLRRDRTDSATSSLVATWFGDGISVAALASAEAEGVHLLDGSDDLAIVLWPFAPATPGAIDGLAVTGAMGGVRIDRAAFFGRTLTRLEHDGEVLLQASAPVSIFARLQHPLSLGPRYARVQTAGSADLSLVSATEPSLVELDGASIPFRWAAGVLTLTVPAGSHLIEVSP